MAASDEKIAAAARQSSAEHLIATKALRCTATTWMLIIVDECTAIPRQVKKYGLSETQVGEFKEAFALFDKDNSGRISQDEFGKVMTSLGQSAPEPELKRMIGEVDLNTDGFIDLAEFMEMLGKKMRHLDNEEEIIEAFKIFDLDGDGQITGDEMQKSLSEMGEDLKREDIDAMMKYVSGGGDSVDYEQFKAMMLNREVPAASS